MPIKSIKREVQQVDIIGDLMAMDDFMTLTGRDLQETPVTDTIKINTTVLGSQFAPAIAVLSGGGYVIVWEDSSAGAIFAQRFSASGQPVGNELHLSSTQGGSALWVSVAATANDGFVIAFQAGSFAQAEIFGQRYDGQNNPAGGLFAVNSTSPNEQFNPHIVTLDGGLLLFTWDTQAFDVFQEVRGRIFTSDGQALGADFPIAAMSAAFEHGFSAIAPLPGGGFVVTWQSGDLNATAFDIVGQRFTSSGLPTGAQFQVNADTANSQYGNDVARLSDGGFVVSWVDDVAGNGGGRVVARHYGADGNPIGGEILVDSKTTGAYGRTVVTALADGGYVIGWIENDGTSAHNNVLARAFGSNDVAQGAAFEMSFNSPFSGNFFSDGAATLSNGNVVFTWDGPSITPPGGQGTGQDIYMRVYNFDAVAPNTPTEGDDVLTDTAGNDTISALGGNDRITLTNGRDNVNGGTGTDTLVLDWGAATNGVGTYILNVDPSGGFTGAYTEGAIQISGRVASFGQIERFIITTGSGADDIVTGNGNDEVSTGTGDDRIDVRDGVNIADGGGDIDAISADLSALLAGVTIDLNNAVNSGAYGSYSNFEYFGNFTGTGLGDIFVTTNLARNDIINSGAGDDTITVRNGTDRVNAGSGIDTLVIDWSNTTQAVTAYQAPTANPNGGFDGRWYAGVINFPDRDIFYTEIERFDITTGSGNDDLRGAGGSDRLTGGAGADSLYGNDGNDTIYGDATDLVLNGGTGIDTLHISGSGLFSGGLSGFEALVLVGNSLTFTRAQFAAGLTADAMITGNGSLTINMESGDYDVQLQQLLVDAGVTMVVNGTADDNFIKGAIGGSNLISGGDGNDFIGGGQQADILNGGTGNDKIEGGQGADILTGGSGADKFRFSYTDWSGVGAAADLITDFEIGIDRMSFSLIDADALTPGDQAFSFVGTDAFANTGIGQIRYQTSGLDLLVQIDTDGNGTADMEVILQSLGTSMLTGGDFVL